MNKENIIKNIKKQNIVEIILVSFYILILCLSPLLIKYYKAIIDYIDTQTGEELTSTLGGNEYLPLVLLFVLLLTLILPFLIYLIIDLFRNRGIVKRIDSLNNMDKLMVSKGFILFICFGIAQITGIIFSYITLKLSYILALLIPLLPSFTCYTLGTIFKLKNLKEIDLPLFNKE